MDASGKNSSTMSIQRRKYTKIIYWNLAFALVLLGLGASIYVGRMHRYDKIIVQTARRNQLDPRLITALIWTESRFDPNQVGSSGEIGLMQVTETAAREWADAIGFSAFKKDDLYQPKINIRAGCWYLARARNYWQKNVTDPLPYALAEYNAGRSNARRWSKEPNGKDSFAFWNHISYPTTRAYVLNILTRYRGGI